MVGPVTCSCKKVTSCYWTCNACARATSRRAHASGPVIAAILMARAGERDAVSQTKMQQSRHRPVMSE